MTKEKKTYSKHSRMYSCLILLLFTKNINKEYLNSIRSLTKVVDKLAQKLDLEINLTYMSKYNIIKNLVNCGILVEEKDNNKIKIALSDKLKEYVKENIEIK